MKTANDFQNFININKILSPKDFKSRFKNVYKRLILLKLSNQVKYTEDYEKSRQKVKFISSLKTIDDFQNYIIMKI